MSTRTKILAAVAALGLLVIVLARGGGEEPSTKLQTLQDDPMATYVPPRGTLVDTDSQNEGMSLGEPVSARYSRMFELPAGTAEDALRQARAAALEAGWKEIRLDDATFAGERVLPSGPANLTIAIFRDARILPKDVRPPALLVNLLDTPSS